MTIVRREWPPGGGRRYEAFVADAIADRAFSIDHDTLTTCDQAAGELGQIGAHLPVAWEPAGRLLLRAEGLASSDIEGIRVDPRRLLRVQAGHADDVPAQWVLDNIDAIERAYDDAAKQLATGLVLEWHRILMGRSPLRPEHIGALRDVQGWIGGMDPTTAVFVPAPPEFIPDLMDDLVRFANRRDLPPVWQAAVLHAQFETIHPFADGNGRVGRALIGWCLRHRRVLARAVPPLSRVIARQPDRYVHGLWLYREGRIDEWAEWFAAVCLAAAEAVAELTRGIADLQALWEERLADLRSDSAARRLAPYLPALPVIDVERAATALGVTDRSARSALDILERRGILEPMGPVARGPGRPPRLWLAGELVGLL